MGAPLSELTVVIITWHSAEDLPPLLASLASVLNAGTELVVVENASGDATPALVRAEVPGATVIVNTENRGFAAAANQGLAASRGAFVLFLNPDTVVQHDAVQKALAHLAADPLIGVLGCRTVNEDGTPQPTVDRFHTVAGLLTEALTSRCGLGSRPRGRSPATTGDVEWVYGSFLLCRREVLAAVGGFDEAYDMYGEDLDLCHRVRAAGFRVVFLAEAVIMHRGNRSGARRYGRQRDFEALKGTLRFFRRRHGVGAERRFRIVAGTSFLAKAGLSGIRALGPDRQRAAESARLYARMAWLCAVGDPAAAADGEFSAAADGQAAGRRLRPRRARG